MSDVIVLDWKQISDLLKNIDVYEPMKKAFIEYSLGHAEIPPVGELLFADPPGEVHIKYGYIKGGSHYVVKIASGFANNRDQNLTPGQGMMILFDINTGVPRAVLIDDANLTDLRTGIAGAIASKTMVNIGVKSVAIIGTGVQARHQAKCLLDVMPLEAICCWGRNEKRLDELKRDLSDLDVSITVCSDLRELIGHSQLIITTTSAKEPIINMEWVQPGTHITAVGSDTPEKCELDPKILDRASVVVADSISQNKERGEIHQGLKLGTVKEEDILELGDIFAGNAEGRTDRDQITVVDLTGVAVQDLVIAEAVVKAKSHID
jgi:ornithine cyclodeaminase